MSAPPQNRKQARQERIIALLRANPAVRVAGLAREFGVSTETVRRDLDELSQAEPELARIVELRFFGGMKHPEIARATNASLRSVERGWSTARAWLFAQLVDGAEDA